MARAATSGVPTTGEPSNAMSCAMPPASAIRSRLRWTRASSARTHAACCCAPGVPWASRCTSGPMPPLSAIWIEISGVRRVSRTNVSAASSAATSFCALPSSSSSSSSSSSLSLATPPPTPPPPPPPPSPPWTLLLLSTSPAAALAFFASSITSFDLLWPPSSLDLRRAACFSFHCGSGATPSIPMSGLMPDASEISSWFSL